SSAVWARLYSSSASWYCGVRFTAMPVPSLVERPARGYSLTQPHSAVAIHPPGEARRMLELYDQVLKATQTIQARWKTRPRVGIILGTGLGGLAQEIAAEAAIPYEEIPHFPTSTVVSHAGRLVCGQLSGKAVVAME